MQQMNATRVPSLVFVTGAVIATLVGVSAPLSIWYGLCASLVYALALAAGGLIEQRRAHTMNMPNKILTRYTIVSLIVLLIATVYAPGWVWILIPAFGVEGFALLRQSPRVAGTKKFSELWQQVRKV